MLQIAERFEHIPVGGSVEACPEAGRICTSIADSLTRCGSGMMLAIDYGELEASDGSLRVFAVSFVAAQLAIDESAVSIDGSAASIDGFLTLPP